MQNLAKFNAMINPFELVKTIDFVDIGCSGFLDRKWHDLLSLLAYTGFDPNAAECQRLTNQSHPYKTARYLPYAIAGEKGRKTMYMTESIYCYSLLRPNYAWLNRFQFSHLFEETGIDSITCTTLDALASEQGLKADILKIDSQGLELPILKAGNSLLENAFCLETETGFIENYLGETTYGQLDEFLRPKGFLLFDLKYYRVSRKNELSERGRHQPLWCEAVWLFDFIGQEQKPTQEQALKSLRICKALRYYDYGLELGRYFNKLGIISSEILRYLEEAENWMTKPTPPKSKIGKLLSLLPKRINKRLMFGLQELLD